MLFGVTGQKNIQRGIGFNKRMSRGVNWIQVSGRQLGGYKGSRDIVAG